MRAATARSLVTVLVFGLLAACARLPESRVDAAGAGGDSTRQILVTTRQGGSAALALLGDPDTVYLRRRGYGPAPDVDRLLDAIAADYGLSRVEGWTIASLGVYCEVYALRPAQLLEDVLDEVAADTRIESVQAMQLFETEGLSYDDPYAPMQPAIAALSIDAAHESATGRGVRVAVIDSSVDGRHPEMRGRVRHSHDFVGGGRAARRPEVHGTAVAGIIASMANNAEGIVGVAPDVEIAALRACWTVDEVTGRARCSSFSLARALETALQLDADIINLSLSGPGDPLLAELIEVGLRRGVIVIAAMPDDDGGEHAFPASHPGVIAARSGGAAASVRPNLVKAPGSEVLSTIPGAGYAFFSGNSMAAAFVAGVSALLVERRPGIESAEVLKLLAETSTPISINACRAIARLSTGSCPAVNEELQAARETLSRTTR
jgi:hypothetical protein